MPKTAALVVTVPDVIALQQVDIPLPGPGEVSIDLLYTAISPGTEARTMRGLQEGVTFPYVAGYSRAGGISAVGAGVDLKVGTLVYLSGMQ